MMDFDQMLDAWRAQDEKPVYGVNAELLQLVLKHEQTDIRRALRRDQWMTYLLGPGMALFGAFWGWVAILKGAPIFHAVAAGVAAAAFALWAGAYWVSRRRQMRRERAFGNSLKDEIGRSLSLVEYQISKGRWLSGVLWTAPVTIGALLIYWLSFQINTGTGYSVWHHAFTVSFLLGSNLLVPYLASRAVKRKLEPRRDRLRELLQTLDASQ